jgi:hypothetical protein
MAAFRFPRLRRADPPPLGVTFPVLGPVMLGGESWDRHGLIEVMLVHGDPLDSRAPLVEVTTQFQDTIPLTSEHALAGVVDRDAAAERGDWAAGDDAPAADPPVPVTFGDGQIAIDGQPVAVSVLTCRHYQAASFRHGGTAGTVASRHCPLHRLNLGRVPAIDPYLDGYLAFLRQLARPRRTR